MRRLLIAAAAIITVAGAAVLAAPRAEAMTLPGVVAGSSSVEQVQLVCRRVWNGYRWVRSCYRAAPAYGYGYGGGYGGGGYGGGYGYVAPRPYYRPRAYYY